MTLLLIILLGLCFGSFVNAFVWRIHTKRDWVKERSVCVHCKHVLSLGDLIPIFSWLVLRGKCRYCKKPISWQYPLVELLTAGLFALSYLQWPLGFDAQGIVLFGFWLVFLVGLMALAVYDMRWMLLPDKIVFPLLGLAAFMVLVDATVLGGGLGAIVTALLGAAFCGGIFYLLFAVSDGKWIGGGDVKLGFLLGAIVGGPLDALLIIFFASVIGSVVSIGLLVNKKAKVKSQIPFGPFLIAATFIVQLYGDAFLTWYQTTFLLV